MDDRRRPVAQGDHLALAARLEARRHREEVGAGVDPARHHPVEPLDEARPAADARSAIARNGSARLGWPLPWTTSRAPRASRVGAASGEQVEALLRIEPPDHPDDRARVGRVEPEPGQQVGPAGRLAGPVLARIRRRQVGVGGRIPDRRVEPVEDPDEPVALGPQGAVESHPERGRERLGGEPGRDGVDQLGAFDALEQEVDAVGIGRRRRRRPAPARAGRAPTAASSRGRRGCAG